MTDFFNFMVPIHDFISNVLIAIDSFHGSFVAKEAESIGPVGPQHDGCPAFVQPFHPFLLYQLLEHVLEATVLALWCSLQEI